ncbi:MULTISPECIES: hypothetical protein [unclassified Arsenophonus]|uniref:hypothetical protein n=1 Tax=unclassified Arsenophonus TaxID=2627083 RepID=UPI00285E9662|nr:hypothetical protein [Arsenophonus sp.]MDR5610765.1 hypothetical protein [Arsenophonus sp.]MDR5615183.1 hypothetical protein [Arsenophonus sp.]
MKTRPVRITARQSVYLEKTVDITEQDYETYLSICEHCRDFDEQDQRLGEIAARYHMNLFEHIQHSDALEDIIFERV